MQKVCEVCSVIQLILPEKLGYLCATHDKNASRRVSGAPQIRAKENSSMLIVHYIFSPVVVVVAMSVRSLC